jgi:hypothetical protein
LIVVGFTTYFVPSPPHAGHSAPFDRSFPRPLHSGQRFAFSASRAFFASAALMLGVFPAGGGSAAQRFIVDPSDPW